jgi:hypothetical protein
MPSNSIKCECNLGKIIPVALKYLIYAMQNGPCWTPQAHGSDVAPMKYPTGVIAPHKYFSRHALYRPHFQTLSVCAHFGRTPLQTISIGTLQ